MIPGWLAEAADAFWQDAGGPPPYPRDLGLVVPFALPVHQHIMPRLRLAGVDDWLRRHGCAPRLDEPNRRLRGCLVALRGHGIIFVDGADEPAERRFTLAHEVAHFVLDYQLPREKAVRTLGPAILPVLDGDRAASMANRVHSVVTDCPLGIHVHLLDRRDATVAAAESRADQLACELLAPDAELSRRYDVTAVDETVIAGDLEETYGLPGPEAAIYARRWCRPRARPVFLSRAPV